MSQNKIHSLKQSYYKSLRKQNLQKRFSQQRKELSKQKTQKQHQMFKFLLPVINASNYAQNRYFLSDFAKSIQYSYEILPVVFLAYQYLLTHEGDLPSWEIIVYLSYYEDFEIPQTQELLSMILGFVGHKTDLASQLILNLSKLPKCTLICSRLIDANFIQLVASILRNNEDQYYKRTLENKQQIFDDKQNLQLQIFNFLLTFSYLFTLQPILEMDQLRQICAALNSQTKSNKFLKQVHNQAIFRLLQNVTQRFSAQKQVLQLLGSQFQETLNYSFFTYQSQCIKFIDCCVKSKVQLNYSLIKNIFISVKSKNNENKVLGLQVLQKLLVISQEAQKMQVQSQKFSNFGSLSAQKILPSFQDFNLMFSSPISNKKASQFSDSQLKNRLTVYSIIFTDNYEKEFQSLLQIFSYSGQKIQEQVVILIKNIFQCLVKQIDCYQPKRLVEGEKLIFVAQDMMQFMDASVQEQHFFVFLDQCLRSSNVPITINSLQIIKTLIIYFQGQEDSQNIQKNNQLNLSYLRNRIRKLNLDSQIQNLLAHQNHQIKCLAEQVLELLQSQQQ